MRIEVCLINYSDGCLAQSRSSPSWRSQTLLPHCWAGPARAERMCDTRCVAAGRKPAQLPARFPPRQLWWLPGYYLAKTVLEEMVSTNPKQIKVKTWRRLSSEFYYCLFWLWAVVLCLHLISHTVPVQLCKLLCPLRFRSAYMCMESCIGSLQL